MTSLNWKIAASVREGRVYIEEAGNPGFPIVTTDTPERAVFVHRACEAHAGLVEALRAIEASRCDHAERPCGCPHKIARAALAAAGAP